MKLDNFVPFGRLTSGKVIIQVMTEFVVTKYQDLINESFIMQSNVFIFMTENRISQCTYF